MEADGHLAAGADTGSRSVGTARLAKRERQNSFNRVFVVGSKWDLHISQILLWLSIDWINLLDLMSHLLCLLKSQISLCNLRSLGTELGTR